MISIFLKFGCPEVINGVSLQKYLFGSLTRRRSLSRRRSVYCPWGRGGRPPVSRIPIADFFRYIVLWKYYLPLRWVPKGPQVRSLLENFHVPVLGSCDLCFLLTRCCCSVMQYTVGMATSKSVLELSTFEGLWEVTSAAYRAAQPTEPNGVKAVSATVKIL